MYESCSSSFDEDEWNKIPCSSALWKWRSLHAANSGVSSRASSIGAPLARPTNTWPRARGYGQLAFHSGRLYLHGGQSTINEATGETFHFKDLHRYDTEKEQWTVLPSAQHDRMAHSMHTIEYKGNSFLLVFGGFDPQGLKPELFDLKRGQWLQGTIAMCERRLVEQVELEREESSSSETPSLANPLEATDVPVVAANATPALTTAAVSALSSTDFLTRSQPQRMRKRLVKRWHHFEYIDNTNRYLHSSVPCRPHAGSGSTKIYVYGGTDAQNGAIRSDLVVVELTDTVMDDKSSYNPCFEMARPECGGDKPGPRLGHQACLLGTDAMLLYGGIDNSLSADSDEETDPEVATHTTDGTEDLYLVHRLDLNTFIWSTIDVVKAPPCRMLFCMCADKTSSRIIVFGGRHSHAEDDGDEKRFVDAFIGQITADIEPTDLSQLRHSITWRRAASHDGPFPREISVAACCSVASHRASSSSSREEHYGQEDDQANGVHCYIFGGENSDAVCVDGLTELTIEVAALRQDDDAADEAEGASSAPHPDAKTNVEDETVLPVDSTSGSSASTVSPKHRGTAVGPADANALSFSNTDGSAELSVGSRSPTTVVGPRQSSIPATDETSALLQALVDAVHHTNDQVRRGFSDMLQRMGTVETRMVSIEDRMAQLERRDNGALHPQQQLINAALRESVAAINKELGMRR